MKRPKAQVGGGGGGGAAASIFSRKCCLKKRITFWVCRAPRLATSLSFVGEGRSRERYYGATVAESG